MCGNYTTKKTTKTLKYSEILKGARERLERGSSSYICLALRGFASAKNNATMDRAYALRRVVMQRLNGFGTYDAWLERNNKKMYKHGLRTDRRFKQGRLAWIDNLIAEYEAKGE